MPFIPVPNVLQVETVYEYHGQIVENTSYWKGNTPWDEAGITAFLDDMRVFISETLMPLLSTGIRFVKLLGTLLDAADSLGIVMAVTPPVTGSQTSLGLPNNVAYVITFNTAARGRSGRGRNYIAGLVSDDEADSNNVSTAFRNGLLSYYTGLRALGADSGIEMVVVSRFQGVGTDGKPIPRTVGVARPVTSFSTFDTVLDSQRRRLPGRGA